MWDPFIPKYVRPTIVVLDPFGRILLVQYCDDNSWGIPGGCLEVGESVEDAARRELLEETGISAEDLELETTLIFKEILSIVYVTRNYTGELRPDGVETKDVRFFSLDELPDGLDQFIRQSLVSTVAD